MIYDTQVCGSSSACFNMFKSERHTGRWGKTINDTQLLYKTLAVWPPQYAAEEMKHTFKCRSFPKNWKCSLSKFLKYRRGNTAYLTPRYAVEGTT